MTGTLRLSSHFNSAIACSMYARPRAKVVDVGHFRILLVKRLKEAGENKLN